MIVAAGAMMLASGALHAVVQAVVKGNKHKFATRGVVDGTAALIALPATLLVPLPSGAWGALLASTILHACYLFCAVKAFEAGDLSAAYPIQRGVAPLLTSGGALVIFREPLTLAAGAGILVLSGSIVAMAQARSLARASLLWACLARLFIAACTLVDATGVRHAPEPLSYIVWLFVMIGPTMVGMIWWLQGASLLEEVGDRWQRGALAGLLSVVGYGMALLALGVGPTAPLAALRETSVIAAYFIGVLVLRETHSARRLLSVTGVGIGAAMILVG